MSQDIHPVNRQRCYSCIQWLGPRTYEPVIGKIKVDTGSHGPCRVSHADTRGSGHCENYAPLR